MIVVGRKEQAIWNQQSFTPHHKSLPSSRRQSQYPAEQFPQYLTIPFERPGIREKS